MKKYACMLIALSAISVFSFSQTFDRSVVLAVGGLDPCNGSDVSDDIPCVQLDEPNMPVCGANNKYKTVTNSQAAKDVLSTNKHECLADGCTNVLNNPRPSDSDCKKHLVAIEIDPPVEAIDP